MATRLVAVLALSLLMVPASWSQTVRFDTNVGNIDLILNPTANPNLNGHVDNILAYVEAGRYDETVLNRAPDGFVLQMGSFATPSAVVPTLRQDFVAVERFQPVVVDFNGDGSVDFSTDELLNDRSTVTLALSGQPNSGTSSFFINVANNNFLDPQGFVPFARVADMSTVDFIMDLNDQNLFGDDVQINPTFTDVPLLEDNIQIFVERAFVLDPNPVVPAVMAATLLAGGTGGGGVGGGGETAAVVASIPEPPALVMVVAAIMVLAVVKGPRRQW